MRCVVCDQNDWENVDKFRLKKEGMCLCKKCGFVSYPQKWQEKEKVLEFYRKQYRNAPTVENLYQGQRKLNYHQEFLTEPVIDVWRKEGKQDPSVFEIGAAYGLVLAWFKNLRDAKGPLFPKIELNGTELTTTFKRNAYHEFGLRLQDDFDDSKSYDLIISYKVAEHMLDIDKEFVRYRKALKPGGKFYVSVPTWFNSLHNFGLGGFSIEYYYSPSHVNVWSRQHFEAVLRRSGFKIVKENHSFYDDTYLCEPCEPETTLSVDLPPVSYIRECLSLIKEADELCQKKHFEEALQKWPNFPVARRAMYEYKRKEWHALGVDEIMNQLVKPWVTLDPDSYDAYTFGADILMRYDKYTDAIGFLKEALARRPKCETVLGAIANCYRQLAERAADKAEKESFMLQSRDVMRFIKEHCLSGFASAVTWVYNDNAHLPIPGE